MYEISNEDRHYGVKENDLRRTTREKPGTGWEKLQPSMEGRTYNSVSKQLQFLMKNDTVFEETNKISNKRI